MRDFGCSIQTKPKKKKNDLQKHPTTVCFAGVRDIIAKKKNNFIYIDDFDCKETRKYQPLLLGLIHKVTFCKIKEVSNRQYIKYRLITDFSLPAPEHVYYLKNLILLNFIRNLWHEPFKNYATQFFTKLEELKDIADPIQRLTTANKFACEKYSTIYHNGLSGQIYGQGHSNVYAAKHLKIKTLKEFKKFKSQYWTDSIGNFLT